MVAVLTLVVVIGYFSKSGSHRLFLSKFNPQSGIYGTLACFNLDMLHRCPCKVYYVTDPPIPFNLWLPGITLHDC